MTVALSPFYLYTLTGILSAVLSGWFVFLRRGRLHGLPGIGLWTWAMILQAVGWLLVGKFSFFWMGGKVWFPGLLLLVPVMPLMLGAFHRLCGVRQNLIVSYAVTIVSLLGISFFTYVHENEALRVLITTFSSLVFALYTALSVSGKKFRLSPALRRGVLWVFIFIAFTLLLRLVDSIIAASEGKYSADSATVMNLLMAFPFFIIAILPSLVFFSACLQVSELRTLDTEARFAELVNSVDGILWQADAETSDFLFVSAKAERLLGYSQDEWLTPGFWTDRMHPEDLSWAPAYCQKKSLELAPHEFEYRMIARDGKTVWLRDIVTVEAEDGNPRWLRGVMVDITEKKQAQEKLQRLTFMYELLSNCRRIISQTNTENELFDAIVRLCVTNSDIRLAWIGLPEDNTAHVRIAAAAGSVTAYLEDVRVSLSPGFPEGRGPTGTAMREKHDVIVNYPDRLPADKWSERRQKYGLHSYAAITFRLSGVRTGSLNLYAGEAGFFTQEIIGLFDQLGADLGRALDRMEAERWRSFAEQSLRENQLLLDFALEATVDAVWDYDAPSGTVRFFRHWDAMLGYDHGELENDISAWNSHVHPDDLQASEAMLERYRRGDIPVYDMRIRLRNKYGQYLWIKDRGLIVERDASGNATRIIGTLKNIDAEVKKAEESRQNAALLDAIFEAAPVAIAVLNRERQLIVANPAVQRIAGVGNDADLKKAISERTFFYPDGQPYARGEVPAPLLLPKVEQDYSAVFGFRDSEKEKIRWVSMNTRYLQGVGLVVRISTDITDIMESERALRETETKFRTLFEGLPIAVSLHKKSDRSLVVANPKMYEYSGLSHEDFQQGLHIQREYLDEHGIPIAMENLPTIRAIRENRLVDNVIIGFRDARGLHWFNNAVLPITELGLYALISKDITVEKNQQQEIRKSEEKFRALFENSPVGVILYDNEGNPVQWNRTAEEQARLTNMHEVYEREYFDESGNLLARTDLPVKRALQSGQQLRNAIFGDRVDGKFRWFHADVVPLPSLGLVLGMTTEITELVESRNALSELTQTLERRVAKRTEALEEINAELEAFSYSLSHDLKAPLTRAESWLNILDHEFRPALGEKGKGMLVYVRNEIGAMKRMNEAMLALSRVARLNIEPVEASLTLKAREIVGQLREENSDAAIELSVPENAVVHADPELLRILLRNLLENAVKFSRGQTPVRIEISCTAEEQHFLCSVRDNGVGFDMRYADRLFAPFQRLHTETEFPGTGIGLATAQRIVHRHGGKIWAESEPGKGTTIYFTLSRGGAEP